MTYYFRVSSSSSTDDERILPLEEEEEEGGPLEPDEEEEEGGPLEPNEEEGPEGQIRRRMFRYVMDSSDSEGSPQYICSPLGPGGGGLKRVISLKIHQHWNRAEYFFKDFRGNI